MPDVVNNALLPTQEPLWKRNERVLREASAFDPDACLTPCLHDTVSEAKYEVRSGALSWRAGEGE